MSRATRYEPRTIREGTSALSRKRRTSAQREVERIADRLSRTIGTKGHRSDCIVVRESSENALEEAADMLEYTLRPLVARGIPGTETIAGLGIKVLQRDAEGEATRRELGAETIFGGVTGRKVIGWLVDLEGTLFVLSLYSAAKTNDKETNDFTDALSGIVEAYDVDNLYTGPVSRIARSKEHAMRLRKACERAGTTVWPYGRREADMTKVEGRDAFDRMVEESVWDYSNTVERLQRGAHAVVMEGQWPKSELALPAVGYKLRDPEGRRPDRTVVPDPTKLDLVRDLLTWKAEGLSDRHIAEKVAKKHGWGSDTLRRRLRDDRATVLDAEHPEIAIRQLWKHLDLFETGRYIYSQRIPVSVDSTRLRDDVQDSAYKDKASGQVFLELDLDFHHDELPEGRWVDPSVIERARANVDGEGAVRRPRGQAATVRDRKPLSSIAEWEDATHQWTLSARNADNYVLKRRELATTKTKTGRRRGWADQEGEIVALCNPAETHRAIADAIEHAISTGGIRWARAADARLDGTGIAEALGEDLQRALTQAQKLHRRAATDYVIATELFEEDPTEANRLGLREALAAKNAAHARLQDAEAAIAESATRSTGPLSASVGIDIDQIALLVAALRKCEDRAAIELNMLARAVIADLRASLDTDGATVRMELSLHATTDEGPIVLGPVPVAVSNRRRAANGARVASLLAARLRDGLSIEEAAAAAGYTDVVAARRRMLAELVDTIPAKGLRSAALDCPVDETRRVLWAMVEAHRTGERIQLDADIDGRFARHIIATYTDPEASWVTAWHVDDPVAARRAIEIVAAAEGERVAWDGLVESIVPTANVRATRTLAEELVTGKGAHGGGDDRVQYDPVLDRSDPWHRHAERTVAIRTCPHCKTATLSHICRAPEVPGGMLCTSCQRTPSDKRVIYPDDYMVHWAGPRGFGVGRTGERGGTRRAEKSA